MDLSSVTPFTRTGTEQKPERADEPEGGQGGGGSWRRKAMLAGAGIGLAMLVRRLRSGSKHERRAAPDEPASAPESHGGGSAGDKSGLSRKLGGFVALVVTTLALRALRKRLLGGSDGNR